MKDFLIRLLIFIRDKIFNSFKLPFYFFYFKLFGFPFRPNWRITGFPIISKARGSNIKIGDSLILRSQISSNAIGLIQPVVLRTLSPNSQLIIGNDVGISGSTIVAIDKIQIGDRVLIGSGVLIVDNDMHPINSQDRINDPDKFEYAPIFIESDVFIGARSIILKGVRIGESAVVGAGSVVVQDVPAFTIVAGNPAKSIKMIEQMHE